MKITHKDDLDALAYYQDFHKILKEDNKMPKNIRVAQKRLSCMFPMISDLTQSENIRTARGTEGGVKDIGLQQRVFSYMFYGNSDYYNLPNAF